MNTSGRSLFRVAILFVVFFFISLLTNIIGPLVPDIIQSFNLSLTMAAFLPFSFFVAYAFMSIPSGMVIEIWGEKPMMLGAFVLALLGSMLFCVFPAYPTAILSLFLIGLGMAALQVAINPLLRVSGGEEHYAFNAVLSQLIFGLASFASPLLYSHFAANHALGPWIPANMPWVVMYWIFSVVSLGMILLIWSVRFPRVERKEDERVGAWATHLELFHQPVVWLYFLGIFSYVGLEQGLSNWMSQFLASQHGMNPQTDGANAVAGFWGMMTVGCLLGLLLLKFFDSKKILLAFSALALAAVTLAIFGPRETALYAFAACGFALSVMWSIVFSLALNSLPKNHGTFSGILCTGIVGGALVPLMIGNLGDAVGLRWGLCVVYVPLLYIAAMGFWAKPLITNQTFTAERT
jgi:MFS transporter, FHS family, L-fucose permease